MKYLKKLQQKKIFTLEDVGIMTGNLMTAKSLMQSYKKAGYVKSIRRNMYAAVDLASGNLIANRYEIASQSSDNAYLSFHSAMEFHGLANQVFYEMSISSRHVIHPFEYEGITYRTHRSRLEEGVITVPYNRLIRVTDIERTIVDCIHDIDLSGGLEEVLSCIDLVPQIDETVVLRYLGAYDEKYLWQKVGLILELYASQLRISDHFFDECERHIGKRKNYIDGIGENEYFSRWKLYVPKAGLYRADGGEEFV